jgi:hypothetical protein
MTKTNAAKKAIQAEITHMTASRDAQAKGSWEYIAADNVINNLKASLKVMSLIVMVFTEEGII